MGEINVVKWLISFYNVNLHLVLYCSPVSDSGTTPRRDGSYWE